MLTKNGSVDEVDAALVETLGHGSDTLWGVETHAHKQIAGGHRIGKLAGAEQNIFLYTPISARERGRNGEEIRSKSKGQKKKGNKKASPHTTTHIYGQHTNALSSVTMEKIRLRSWASLGSESTTVMPRAAISADLAGSRAKHVTAIPAFRIFFTIYGLFFSVLIQDAAKQMVRDTHRSSHASQAHEANCLTRCWAL